MIDYDPHDWRSHLCDIRGSMVLEIMPRVMVCTAWGALITYLHQHHFQFVFPTNAHMMAGTVLGLLLVFRTNSSYDRFWEGRRMWGNIINETRNLGRAATVALIGTPELQNRIVRWTVAFCYAVQYQLRGVKGLHPIASELPEEEVEQVLKSKHLPTATARQVTAALNVARQQGLITPHVFVALDQNVQLLVDYAGSCERIHKTPLPFAYVVHLRRALIVYCYTMPFALVDLYGWWTIAAVFLLSYLFMGIEEIGVEIEDPFGSDDNDLPMDLFCQRIHEQLADLITADSTASVIATTESATVLAKITKA
jgi:putative membrane protein